MGRFGATEIILIFIVIGVMLIPQIFYLISLQKTLNEVSNENRKMQPNLVWLVLIPIFGLIWQFIVVNGIASSLQDEFKKRNIKVSEEKPGHTIGLTYCILFCCSIIPLIGVIAGMAGFVCWIIYWVKINNYRIELQTRGNIEDIGINN
jgi:hypothetical protein